MKPRTLTLGAFTLLTLLFCICFGSQSAHAAGGLLLFTSGGSSYVSAVQYETFTSPSAHLSYITVKGGQKKQIQSSGIIAQIPFPSSGSSSSIEDSEEMISQAEMLSSKYPQYAKLLQSVGELWKRKLEADKLTQAQPKAVVAATQSGDPSKIIFEGAASTIPIVMMKSGQTLKNVQITRFEDDKAVISHDGGIGRLLISDIANTSAFPADAKAAVEKAQAGVNAKRMAEADRIVAENAEKERIAKQEEEKHLAQQSESSSEHRPVDTQANAQQKDSSTSNQPIPASAQPATPPPVKSVQNNATALDKSVIESRKQRDETVNKQRDDDIAKIERRIQEMISVEMPMPDTPEFEKERERIASNTPKLIDFEVKGEVNTSDFYLKTNPDDKVYEIKISGKSSYDYLFTRYTTFKIKGLSSKYIEKKITLENNDSCRSEWVYVESNPEGCEEQVQKLARFDNKADEIRALILSKNEVITKAEKRILAHADLDRFLDRMFHLPKICISRKLQSLGFTAKLVTNKYDDLVRIYKSADYTKFSLPSEASMESWVREIKRLLADQKFFGIITSPQLNISDEYKLYVRERIINDIQCQEHVALVKVATIDESENSSGQDSYTSLINRFFVNKKEFQMKDIEPDKHGFIFEWTIADETLAFYLEDGLFLGDDLSGGATIQSFSSKTTEAMRDREKRRLLDPKIADESFDSFNSFISERRSELIKTLINKF